MKRNSGHKRNRSLPVTKADEQPKASHVQDQSPVLVATSQDSVQPSRAQRKQDERKDQELFEKQLQTLNQITSNELILKVVLAFPKASRPHVFHGFDPHAPASAVSLKVCKILKLTCPEDYSLYCISRNGKDHFDLMADDSALSSFHLEDKESIVMNLRNTPPTDKLYETFMKERNKKRKKFSLPRLSRSKN